MPAHVSPHWIPIFQIAAGILLVFLGRKLFWLFVGTIGFLAGLQLGSHFGHGYPEIAILTVALVIGILGAVLAILAERVAVAIAGAIAGGMIGLHIAVLANLTSQAVQWVAFAVGAVFAAIVVSLLFDWALIVISSLTGAVMIAEKLQVTHQIRTFAVVAFCFIGIFSQARLLRPAVRKESR
ncbi:MAG: hypothetical protein ABI443_08450 [Chthoniobacterales bacterium]